MASTTEICADCDLRVTQARHAERIQDLGRRVEVTERTLGEINQRLMIVLGGMLTSAILLAVNLVLSKL